MLLEGLRQRSCKAFRQCRDHRLRPKQCSTLRLVTASLGLGQQLPRADRLSPPDEQTEIDDEISDQLNEDGGSRHDVAIMSQIPSGFGQNRGILFFAEGQQRF